MALSFQPFLNILILKIFKILERYNANNFTNDISILTFAGAFNLNEYVVPMTLPDFKPDEWLDEGDVVRVCGWVSKINAIMKLYILFMLLRAKLHF